VRSVSRAIIVRIHENAGLGESIRWNHLAGFALIVLATWLIFLD